MWSRMFHRSRSLFLARRTRVIAVLGLSLLVFLLGQWTMFRGATLPNERSRMYLCYSLVEYGEWNIDHARQRFGHVFDEATYQGKTFTDKAPGASVIAIVPYVAARLFIPEQELTVHQLLEIGRLGVMLPSTVLGVLLLFGLLTRASAFWPSGAAVSSRSCALLLTAWLFGTAAFHYSAAFFGHQLVAVLWLAATRLLCAPTGRRVLLCGAILGLAVMVEYQAAIGLAASMLALCEGSVRRWARPMLGVMAGATLPLLLLLLYHTHSFGGPLELPYHHLTSPALARVHQEGIGGVSVPSLDGVIGTLFSMHRGLFSTSPFAVLLIPALGRLWAWRLCSTTERFAGLAILGYVLMMMSSRTWEAGWGYGPRLLVPIMPLVVLLIARFAVGSSAFVEGVFRGGVFVAVLGHLGVAVTFREPPDTATNPIRDVVLPLLGEGYLAPVRFLPAALTVPVYFVVMATLLVTLGVWFSRRERRRRVWLGVAVVPLIWLSALGVLGPSGSSDERAALIRLVERFRRAEPAECLWGWD